MWYLSKRGGIIAGAVAALALGGIYVAKNSGEAPSPVTIEAREGRTPLGGKPSIPLEIAYQVTPSASGATILIQLTPSAPVRNSRLRIALPDGLQLRSGELMKTLGAIPAGRAYSHTIQVEMSERAAFGVQVVADAVFEEGEKGSRSVLVPVQAANVGGVSTSSAGSMKVRNAGESEGAQQTGELKDGIISLPADE